MLCQLEDKKNEQDIRYDDKVLAFSPQDESHWVIQPPFDCLPKVKERRNHSTLKKSSSQADGSPEHLSCNHRHVAVGLRYAVLFLDQKTKTLSSSYTMITTQIVFTLQVPPQSLKLITKESDY